LICLQTSKAHKLSFFVSLFYKNKFMARKKSSSQWISLSDMMT